MVTAEIWRQRAKQHRDCAVTPVSGIWQRSLDDRGSATVVMLGVISVVLMLTVSGLLLASAVLASHRARAAADLAALSAAGVLIRGAPVSTACESAAQVAAANHGRVQRCIASGREVRLSVTVPAGLRGLGIATARSRAGPGPHAW
jgi:secretion/DNA translocation related TadE-like protein